MLTKFEEHPWGHSSLNRHIAVFTECWRNCTTFYELYWNLTLVTACLRIFKELVMGYLINSQISIRGWGGKYFIPEVAIILEDAVSQQP